MEKIRTGLNIVGGVLDLDHRVVGIPKKLNRISASWRPWDNDTKGDPETSVSGNTKGDPKMGSGNANVQDCFKRHHNNVAAFCIVRIAIERQLSCRLYFRICSTCRSNDKTLRRSIRQWQIAKRFASKAGDSELEGRCSLWSVSWDDVTSLF